MQPRSPTPVSPKCLNLQELGDAIYLVMEYVAGSSLRQLIQLSERKGRAFSQGFACFVTSQLADALHYAYNARGPKGAPLRIVHRDVNPKNVMVGENGEVKLLDFGIAYSYLENRDRTRSGVLKGTYSYMSPEQADGERQLDSRSDLFALGIMLGELLTGQRPFDAGATFETKTMRRIIAASPDDVKAIAAHLPRDLGAIVTRALAKDRNHRFASGAELATALRAFLVKAQIVYGPTEVVEELHELAEAPVRDAADPAAKVKVFVPASPGATTRVGLDQAGASRNGASESRLRKRAATRDKLHNPEDPRPRLLKPLLLVVGVAIAAQIVLFTVIKLNRGHQPDTSKIEVVKTASQIKAEAEAAERAREPEASRPQLADVHDPSAALQAGAPELATATPGKAASTTPNTLAPQAVPPPPHGGSPAKRRVVPVAMNEPSPPAPIPASEPAPLPAPAAPIRRRSLDSSTATTFADVTTPEKADSATGGPSLLPKGTLVPALLLTPADANNPGPVIASVTKDVSGPSGVVVPKGSSLVCTSAGPVGQARVGVTCESVTVGTRSIPLSGTALGPDQLKGIPVVATADAGTADPARTAGIDIVGRLARQALGNGSGAAGSVIDSAVGAGQETTRRATEPGSSSLQPAPKGTRFFLFLSSIGGR